MKQLLQRTFALRAIVLVALLISMVSGTWAEEAYYTLDTSVAANKTTTNAYANSGTVTVNGIEWKFEGNGQMTPWRLGGKSLSKVDRKAYTNTPMNVAISKIDLTVGAASDITVNSLKLVVASDANFSTILDQVTASFVASSTISFEPTSKDSWAENAYYKFVFNVSVSSSSNKFVEFSKVEFYQATSTEDIAVTGISLNKEAISLEVGATETLIATISPEDATNQTVTWSSSNEDVVTVADDGVVTAKSAGTATITATSEDGSFTATCAVTVTPSSDTRQLVNITGFRANKTELVKGENVGTEVLNDQSDWTASYTYTSSNQNVATIAADGTITAVSKGTATITAALNIAADDENFKVGETTSASIEIEVVNPSHTVIFSVNGNTDATNTFEEGATITFPTGITAVNEKEFVGWVETPIDNVTDEAPSFVTAATMGDSDKTYYAVFATKAGTAAEVTDELNRGVTGITGTSYSSWKDKSVTSSAVYAGNSAGGNSAIQLRSSNNNSGIVSTTSGGRVAKVEVEWNTNTAANRTINIYGSNTAYESAADLYSNNKMGTLVGSISYDQTELTFTDEYAYFGLRSNNGALYLDKVSVTWFSGSTSFSGYCTTVAADTREEAGISFAEAAITQELMEGYTGQALTNPNNLTVTFTSSNKQVATIAEDGTLIVLAVGETTITATFAGNDDYKAATVSYVLTIEDNRAEAELAFSEDKYTATKGEENAFPTLTNPNELTVSYESSDAAVATIDPATGAITLLAEGTTTITATFSGNNEFKPATASYTLTVYDPYVKGREKNPYTVAEAVDAIDNNGTTSSVYVTGIVSQVDSYSSGAITYWISADGTTTNQFEVYRGKNTNGDNFSSVDDVKVGDVVVVRGNIVLYNSSIYEFSAGSQLVSLVSKLAAPTFYPGAGAVSEGTEVTIFAAEGATIYYTLDDTEPTTESTEYTEAITISETTTIKAFAVKEGIPSSDVSEATYTIAAPAANPTFSVAAGTYSSAQSVVISCETEDATIYYTLDGTEPTTESTEYTEAVVINETTTIKAIAVKEGLANSEVSEATYTIQIPSITLSSNTIAATYKENEGTLEVTYNYITEVDAEVVFCDAEGTAATYDWIEAEINAENNIAYVISANASEEARTAYMKVYTLDDDANDVYSEIITITQEGKKTYYALVAQYDGKYYAVNAQGGTTWGATEVEDVVNGKVLNGTDDIAWEIIPNGKAVGLRNKTKTDNGSWIYIGYAKSGTNLQSSSSIVSWTVDSDNKTWTNQNGNTSGTVRSIIYNESSNGFKNYAVSNANGSEYGSYTHAYTFADGYVRTVTAGNWGTFCVDHSIAADDYSGVRFYSIAGKDQNETYISLKEETELMAGVAYIFQANEGATKLVAAYSNESIDEPFAAEDNNGLAGSFTGQSVEEGMYLLSGGKIVKCGTGCSIAANRAYIDMTKVPVLSSGSASEGLVKMFFGTTDAVRGINADNLNGAVIYDLSGRRLQSAQRGLYIVNGKKVAVK